MKRIITITLAAVLCLTLTACTQTEEPSTESSSVSAGTSEASAAALPDDWEPLSLEAELVPLENDPYMEALSGDWYGTVQEVIICLNLNADGSYSFSVPSLTEETVDGSWSYENGQLLLDNDESQEILVTDAGLYWPEMDADMTREKPETYVPGEPLTDAEEADFTGYWVSLYVDMDGYIIPSHFLEDDTDVYLEGNLIALGGSLFGDIAREFTLKDGAMVYENGDISIALQFLNDGMLKLTVTAADGQMVHYLTPQAGAADMAEIAAEWPEGE
ncbi:MAG: hypothetical protein IKG08_00130 [Eubacterium sp.]|nr:hypothetical protein [Eubacterium sp.]